MNKALRQFRENVNPVKVGGKIGIVARDNSAGGENGNLKKGIEGPGHFRESAKSRKGEGL